MDELMDELLKITMMSNESNMMSYESVTFNDKLFHKNKQTDKKHTELGEMLALLNTLNTKIDDLSNQINSKKTQYDELSKNKDKDNNADNNADILKNIIIEIRELINEKKKCLGQIDMCLGKQNNLITYLSDSD
jgi:hypothetical protein